jgi:hypothetical protein
MPRVSLSVWAVKPYHLDFSVLCLHDLHRYATDAKAQADLRNIAQMFQNQAI